MDSSTENSLRYSYTGADKQNDGFLPLWKDEIEEKEKSKPAGKRALRRIDRPAFLLLTLLYLLQGVPVGLAFGSVPFILKSKLTYVQVGIFSFASYPYSLKLLWSPIIDALYLPRVGRRRSWIIPIQTVSGLTLLFLGLKIDRLLAEPELHLKTITTYFFLLVFFCASQDIAVDGWALTCLSPDSLSFASTAQTIGMNTGYFSSFTIFLALSSPDFSNKYLRSVPQETGLFTLGNYLIFWGCMYLIVTGILLFVPEDPPHLAKRQLVGRSHEKSISKPSNIKSTWQSLKKVYLSMYEVLKLRNIQTLVVILLFAKLGFQVNDSATNLKLLEKGLSKEDLSITVLIDFPFEMIFGYYAGTWSSGKSPLVPWMLGFAGRLMAAICAQLLLYLFPTNGKVGSFYFLLILLQHLFSSFMSTIQFVSLCAFFNNIADPSIGGTYMTTLNTLSNYGGTWPKFFIFYIIDKLTISVCLKSKVGDRGANLYVITSEHLKEQCEKDGNHVRIIRDGFYYANMLCILCGIVIFFWVRKKAMYLQNIPKSNWRVRKNNS